MIFSSNDERPPPRSAHERAEGTGVTPSLGVGSNRASQGRTTLDAANGVAGSSRGRPQTRGGLGRRTGGMTRDGPRGGGPRPRRSGSIARMRGARPARSGTRSGTGRPGSPKGRRGNPSTDAPRHAGEGRCNRPRDATRSCRSRLRGRARPGPAPWPGRTSGSARRTSLSRLPPPKITQSAVHRLDARRAIEFPMMMERASCPCQAAIVEKFARRRRSNAVEAALPGPVTGSATEGATRPNPEHRMAPDEGSGSPRRSRPGRRPLERELLRRILARGSAAGSASGSGRRSVNRSVAVPADLDHAVGEVAPLPGGSWPGDWRSAAG